MAEIIAGQQSLDRSGATWVFRSASPTSAVVAGLESGTAFATDGHVSVLFDGYLHEPAPSSAIEARPAERVLAEFLRKDSSAFESLRGAYSIIVVDARRDEILAVRDHMGTVPLFWADSAEEGVFISPSPTAIAARPEVGNALNLAALGEWALLRWLNVEETLFQRVRRVPAGHFLRVAGTNREVIRYWYPLAVRREDWVTEDDFGRFDDVFALAIRRCLELGHAGILLSGGLDSASVAAIAKVESDASGHAPPLALSIAFPHESCNEEAVQRSVAQILGLPQIMRGLFEAAGDDNLLRRAMISFPEWPQPAISYWIPSYESLMREGVEQGCRVMLTGMGGDEWLTVSPYYASNLIRRGRLIALYRLWRGYTRSNNAPTFAFARNMLWRFGARDVLLGVGSRLFNRMMPGAMAARRSRLLDGAFPPWAIPNVELRAVVRARMLAARDDHSERDLYRRELESGLLHPLVALEAEENHERGLRAGAPLRHPFLDADVVQFLARTPPELLHRGGRSKGPVRQMVARRLPGLGFERQKKLSATSFSSENLLEKLPIVWNELGGLTELATLGVVDESGIEFEASRAFRQQDSAAVHRLWYLLALEVWVRGQRCSEKGGRNAGP
jgi:asparagine synthase (glutamine-hydrolysing)